MFERENTHFSSPAPVTRASGVPIHPHCIKNMIYGVCVGTVGDGVKTRESVVHDSLRDSRVSQSRSYQPSRDNGANTEGTVNSRYLYKP